MTLMTPMRIIPPVTGIQYLRCLRENGRARSLDTPSSSMTGARDVPGAVRERTSPQPFRSATPRARLRSRARVSRPRNPAGDRDTCERDGHVAVRARAAHYAANDLRYGRTNSDWACDVF